MSSNNINNNSINNNNNNNGAGNVTNGSSGNINVNNNNNNNGQSATPSPILNPQLPTTNKYLNTFEGSVDLLDSLDDSPQFRKQLKDHEQNIEELGANIKKILKSAKQSCEMGIEYNTSFKSFADDLLSYRLDAGVKDELLEKGMIKFTNALKEICNFREVLHFEMEALIHNPLQEFAENDLKLVKEQYKKYDKYSQAHDTAASKLGQVKKKNSTKIEEIGQEVNDAYKQRIQHSLDLVETINEVQARRRFEFLELFFVYLHAQSTFFHQGYELFKDLEPHMRIFSNYLQSTRKHYEEQKKKQALLKKDLISRTNLQSSPTQPHLSSSPGGSASHTFTQGRISNNMVKKGYLFKKSDYSYSRKFFSCEDGKLSYFRTGSESTPSHVFDLFLCTVRVREDLDRRNCFEVLSPDRSIVLQAESQESMTEWIQVIQNATANLINNISPKDTPNTKKSNSGINSTPNGSNILSPPQQTQLNMSGGGINGNNSNNSINVNNLFDDTDTPLTMLRKLDPSNLVCADCNAKDPDWASINFGSIVCIDCSGIHRSLGVHITKVRSLVLDKWEPELLGMMKSIGNAKVNRIFEANVPSDRVKPTINNSFDVRAKWIRDKYDKRLFVSFIEKPLEELNDLLYKASGENDIAKIMELIASGADPNSSSPSHKKRTPLHNAVANSQSANVCLLLQNGAHSNAQDIDGNTPLHVAAECGSAICCILLIMKGAQLLVTLNKQNKTALDLSVDNGHVSCVAILRLAILQKDEGKATSFDDGFAELLRGFSKEK